MRYTKYHGLGNDYLVIEPEEAEIDLSASRVRLICHRNYGVGSDGILFGPMKAGDADFALRIFNPDGSEAEKSGNGLRIFSRYLWDQGLVGEEPFLIHTLGGLVRAQVLDAGSKVRVEMGTASFNSSQIPVLGSVREVIKEKIEVDGVELTYCAATVGNPHCIVLRDDISESEAKRLGPLIETDPRFPNRTNVQFMRVLDSATICIEIWERGAGYTLASGSSSCAAAAVAYRLGLCKAEITVRMPGGEINVAISHDYNITMTGPIVKVCEGSICEETLCCETKAQAFEI